MNVEELRERLKRGAYDATLRRLYPGDEAAQRARYLHSVETFGERFGMLRPVSLYSAPGLTELGGNHTGRQHGRVLAAAITLDTIAAVAPNDRNVICIFSEGIGEWRVNLERLGINPGETGTPAALIRGVAARFYELDLRFGGFDAYITSDLPVGGGLASSAAFEVLVALILAHLYNRGRVPALVLAKMGQFAENHYFGNPCGLMDQCISAVGGLCDIDFRRPGLPVVESLPWEPVAKDYALCLVEAGGSQEGRSALVAAVREEMLIVAQALGADALGDASEAELLRYMGVLRGQMPDRALLRALHFYGENHRVQDQAEALRAGDTARFLALVRESGHSAQELLQNSFPDNQPGERSLSLALALCARLLRKDGAWRVHGSGFIGRAQALVPIQKLEQFREGIEAVFGPGACRTLTIRQTGGTVVDTGEEV